MPCGDPSSTGYDGDMLTGFARYSDGTVARIATFDELRAAYERPDSVVWVDIEAPEAAELAELDTIINVDDEALDDCLHGEQRPRIDEFEDHIFIVLYGAVGTESLHEFDPRKLAAFCGSRYVVTVHRESLASVAGLRERSAKNPAAMLAAGAAKLLYLLIDGVVDKYMELGDNLETRVENLENRSLARDIDDTVLTEAADLRGDLLELRQLAFSQRELLTPVRRGEYDFLSDSLAQRFGHVCDHLSNVIDLVDTLREQLHNVRDNYHTALANRTNDIMKTLTIFATIMLPLTCIAGIYGMNLPLWPPPEHPASFWGVMGSMVIIAAGLLYFFRRRGWL